MLVAYGPPSKREARLVIAALAQHMPGLPVAVISDEAIDGAQYIPMPDGGPRGRIAKLSVDLLSPFDATAYVDADVSVLGDISAGFAIVEDGWDIALTASHNQGRHALKNIGSEEKRATLNGYGCQDVLALQCGLVYFRCSAAVHALFAAWRAEFATFAEQDQAAFLRALGRVPVRVWLLSSAYNSPWKRPGVLCHHQFGRARR